MNAAPQTAEYKKMMAEYEQMFRAHSARAKAYLHLMFPQMDDEEIKDVNQEFFVSKVFVNWDKTFRQVWLDEDDRKFAAFLRKSLKNQAIDMWRKNGRGRVLLTGDPELFRTVGAGVRPAEDVVVSSDFLSRFWECVREAVGVSDDGDDDTVYLVAFMAWELEMKSGDIAHDLGIPSQAVYRYRHRALQKLGRYMSEHDFDVEFPQIFELIRQKEKKQLPPDPADPEDRRREGEMS